MVKEFIDFLAADGEGAMSSGLEVSLESHYIALAAETSRKEGGKAVEVAGLRT